MKRRSWKGILILAGGLASASAAPAFCAIGEPAVIESTRTFRPRAGTFQLLDSGSAGKDPMVFVWDVDAGPDWFKPYAGTDPAYREFTEWVRGKVDPTAKSLLKRNRDIAKKIGWSTERFDLILGGRLGSIRPIDRLEAEILLVQLCRFGKPYEGEILAFILRKADTLRIYGYATATQRIKPGILRRRLEADIADHWEYYANLHNHPFIFSGQDRTSGELSPSGDKTDGDVQYCLADFEDFGLQRVWITNGFDTLEITAKEFPTLMASPDPNTNKKTE